MVKWDKAFIPRAYYDNPVVEPTIKKAFEPMCPGGGAKDQAAADAMNPQYKCVDCNGFRLYGVGNPRKAAVGFPGKKFFFCSACKRLLKQEDRAADSKRIAEKRRAAVA